jgi:cobalamin biosynthesis protein CobT
MKQAKTDAVKFPIAFPTLLCSIMIDQHPDLVTSSDLPKKRESPLTIHQKLFGYNHVPDIAGTYKSVPSAKLMTKQDIVAALKDTCVMLDERKVKFELMIHALEGKNDDAEDEEADSEKDVDDEDESEKEDEEAGNEDDEMSKEDGEEQSRSSSEVEE